MTLLCLGQLRTQLLALEHAIRLRTLNLFIESLLLPVCLQPKVAQLRSHRRAVVIGDTEGVGGFAVHSSKGEAGLKGAYRRVTGTVGSAVGRATGRPISDTQSAVVIAAGLFFLWKYASPHD